MTETELSIPELLKARADQQPDDVAYTFYDYDLDPAGFAETLTWDELYQRVNAVARELSRHGSPGDRAAILAPQGMDYIVAFYGAMQAGFIAVPLPVPLLGGLDERVVGALRDSSPTVILSTSAVVDDVVPYANAQPGGPAATVIEVDALDCSFGEPVELDSVPKTAYLQYTSGSTRSPAGVVLTHKNVISNLDQILSDYLENLGGEVPQDTAMVSWLPFYHDMGLVMGVLVPLKVGRGVLMSPMAFLQKPARWIRHLATQGDTFTAAPNFAFELSVRRTSDADLAGLDLGRVMGIISGSERIHPATLQRFNDRFGEYGLPDSAVRPSYGLAEATVYVVGTGGAHPPTAVRFNVDKLTSGHAELCGEQGSELVGCGAPRSCDVRIVDPESLVEKSAGEVGEIWVHGDQVASGYWRNPELSERTFGGLLADPSAGTPRGPWLRTGDLGVLFEGELFIIGRIKDLLIIDGRNHYPDDIEATVQEITGGRVAAVSIPDETTEQLVAIAEFKIRGDAASDEVLDELRDIKRRVLSAVKKVHGVRMGDFLLVAPGSLPITSSGKVRRSTSVERYRLGQFSRLDNS